jgi:uncharacterized protein YerC/hydrogenase maturation factor
MHSEVQLITPEKAAQLLLINTNNRHLTRSNVDFFAKQLRNGEWMLTHQGIAITKSGKLADGQHRLTAVVETGIPAQMLVTTGLDDNAFAVLDTGRARRASDVLSIQNGKQANVAASAVKLYILYENNPNFVWSGSVLKLGNSAILEKYNQDRETWNRLSHLANTYSVPKVLVPSPFACMAYIAEKKGINTITVEQIAHDLKHGANLQPGDPVLAYRNKLSYGEKTNGQSRLADYIKLLNARLQGQTLKIFKQQQFPPMPSIQHKP